jgi:hypothetical protein
MKTRGRRSKAETNRAPRGGQPIPDAQAAPAGIGRTALELLVHDIGNSISAAALQVTVLSASALSPSQRAHADSALAQLRTALDRLGKLRRRRGREAKRSQ